MAVRPTSRSLRVGEAFEFLPAGTYTLYDRPNKPATCARSITAIAAGNWTVLRDAGEVDSPAGAVDKGFVFDADVSAITSSAAILVRW